MESKGIMDLFKAVYQKELDYYLELLLLSKEQRDVIKENKLDELHEILKEKDKIIKKVDELEEKIKPYKEQIINDLGLKETAWLIKLKEYQDSDSELKGILVKLLDLLKDLIAIDNENQQLIQNNKSKLIQEMAKLKTGVKVNRSYNSKPTRIHSTFIDNKR
ncbi:hypothetical protein U472_03370 [Orenia metallireducens]|uniref:FlgN protein n=1 Tax=Orenia metallireducens TaxID=1413210 RepID=A0A1C0AB65_9FIRM|nr:flagellar export chaperone FlgN [Orenia metallireducens]OCL27606.1 hypothetical protein U472_03370 [Orenia metallireducens]